MEKPAYNRFCKNLGHTTHVVQWGGSDVWKIGGKVFAIGAAQNDGAFGVTFKVSPIAFEFLKEQDGCRPAPYLASRGMKWIQLYTDGGLSDSELKDYLRESFKLVAAGLSKKTQRDLGLLPGT